ncbi:MAG TPA: CopG family antitoxin [Rhizomicrobium sp.]|nr:CopG family antitoxin [Rhizomicrobium sp.]
MERTVRKPRPIPQFKSEPAVATETISLRLPTGVLDQIKIAANKCDVPYQSLIKMWLAEKVG